MVPHDDAVRMVVTGPLCRSQLPELCARADDLLERCKPGSLICDVGALGTPDLVAVDALARLRLKALRRGVNLELENASPELVDLLAFAGLERVLLGDGASVGLERQPEQREEIGVEEAVDASDPTV